MAHFNSYMQLLVIACFLFVYSVCDVVADDRYASRQDERPAGRWLFASDPSFYSAFRSDAAAENYLEISDQWKIHCWRSAESTYVSRPGPDRYLVPRSQIVNVRSNKHLLYQSCFDLDDRAPLWTYHVLEKGFYSGGGRPRVSKWFHWLPVGEGEPKISAGTAFRPAHRARWDRGHLVPNSDFSAKSWAAPATFTVLNRVPQEAGFNQNGWRCVENLTRDYLSHRADKERLHIITGIVPADEPGAAGDVYSTQEKGGADVPIPGILFKLMIDVESPGAQALLFWRQNDANPEHHINMATFPPRQHINDLGQVSFEFEEGHAVPVALLSVLNNMVEFNPKVDWNNDEHFRELVSLLTARPRREADSVPDAGRALNEFQQAFKSYCKTKPPLCPGTRTSYLLLAKAARSSPRHAGDTRFNLALHASGPTCASTCVISDLSASKVESEEDSLQFTKFLESMRKFLILGRKQPCYTSPFSPWRSRRIRKTDYMDPRTFHSIKRLNDKPLGTCRPLQDMVRDERVLVELQFTCSHPG